MFQNGEVKKGIHSFHLSGKLKAISFRITREGIKKIQKNCPLLPYLTAEKSRADVCNFFGFYGFAK